SKKIVCARFVDGAFDDFRAIREFAAYVDVGRARIERVTGDQNSFQQLMRIFVDDIAIFERTRLGFIGVTDEIDWPFFVRFDEAPFKTAGKTGSAAAAQPRVLDFVNDLAARQGERLRQLFV